MVSQKPNPIRIVLLYTVVRSEDSVMINSLSFCAHNFKAVINMISYQGDPWPTVINLIE